MADIYTSTLNIVSTILPEFIQNNALQALQESAKIARLVYQRQAQGTGSKQYSIPVAGTVTPTSVGETADLTSTAYTFTDATVTLGEIGFMTLLTDRSVETSVLADIASQIVRDTALGIGRKIDTDLAALFPALNTNSRVGTTASTLSVAIFLRALYNLELNNVQGDFCSVLHPIQLHSLRNSVAASSAIVTAAEFMPRKADNNGSVGNLYGVEVIQCAACATSGGGTSTTRNGAMMGRGDFSPLALVTWRNIRVEPQRDASRRGTEINVTTAYGVKELRDKSGICIVSR